MRGVILNVAPLPDVPTVALDPNQRLGGGHAGNRQICTSRSPGRASSGTWTATKTAAWLTIVAPMTPQSVDGDVTYAVAANVGAMRTS